MINIEMYRSVQHNFCVVYITFGLQRNTKSIRNIIFASSIMYLSFLIDVTASRFSLFLRSDKRLSHFRTVHNLQQLKAR